MNLIEKPFAKDLAQRLGRAMRIENDENCFVVAEANDGAGAYGVVVFGIIVGMGTDGGLFANRALVPGANAISGEWEHNRLPWDVFQGLEREYYCGGVHCVETYLSGPGLIRTYVDSGGGPS